MKRRCIARWILPVLLLVVASPPNSAQDRDGVEQRAKLQTVMLEACGRTGAGVVVGEDAQWLYVLTAYHVAFDDQTGSACETSKARVLSPTGRAVEAPFETTPGKDCDSDLAAIRIAKSHLAGVRLHFSFNLARNPNTLRRGDHLFMVGFVNSQSEWFVPPEPFFFASLKDQPGDRPHVATLLFGPPSNAYQGMSGGPICNADGEIVGIVVGKGSETGSSQPISFALDRFKSWKLKDPRLFVERRYPVMKPHYTEIGADAAFPNFTNGLAGDGPGAALHIAHGISRSIAATFDTTILYTKGTFPDFVETQQIILPSGGLQFQPLAGLARKSIHEILGGVYIGGGLGWEFVARSVQGTNVSVRENLSSLMLATEVGYRWPLPPRGWGTKIGYRVYQPIRSEGLERASSFTLGLYGIFR